MLRWFVDFLRRFIVFSVVVLGAARTYSWLLGYDDEMKAWAAENRPMILLVLVPSGIMYAM